MTESEINLSRANYPKSNLIPKNNPILVSRPRTIFFFQRQRNPRFPYSQKKKEKKKKQKTRPFERRNSRLAIEPRYRVIDREENRRVKAWFNDTEITKYRARRYKFFEPRELLLWRPLVTAAFIQRFRRDCAIFVGIFHRPDLSSDDGRLPEEKRVL